MYKSPLELVALSVKPIPGTFIVVYGSIGCSEATLKMVPSILVILILVFIKAFLRDIRSFLIRSIPKDLNCPSYIKENLITKSDYLLKEYQLPCLVSLRSFWPKTDESIRIGILINSSPNQLFFSSKIFL